MRRSENEEEEPKYYINGDDPYPPVRYKESRRHHRRNKEFSNLVKREKFRIVKGRCEICNKKLFFKSAHFHHILSLSYAFHYYPEIPDAVLKSVENCQVLCECCHVDIHKKDSLAFYASLAQNLLVIIDEWEPLEHPLRHKKKKKRKREHATKYNQALKKRKKQK